MVSVGLQLTEKCQAKRNNTVSELMTFRITKAKAKTKSGVKYPCEHECERSSVPININTKAKATMLGGELLSLKFMWQQYIVCVARSHAANRLVATTIRCRDRGTLGATPKDPKAHCEAASTSSHAHQDLLKIRETQITTCWGPLLRDHMTWKVEGICIWSSQPKQVAECVRSSSETWPRLGLCVCLTRLRILAWLGCQRRKRLLLRRRSYAIAMWVHLYVTTAISS